LAPTAFETRARDKSNLFFGNDIDGVLPRGESFAKALVGGRRMHASEAELICKAAFAAVLAALAVHAAPAFAAPPPSTDARHTAGGEREGPAGREFYFNVPDAVPAGAKRGDILWMRQRDDAPAGSQGWRMIYVTEGVGGRLTYVGGEIYVPTAQAAGDRRVALWNHPTAGNEDACAPSWGGDPSGTATSRERVPAIAELLKRGYVVVMSDYQGLGTPGGSSYMDGPLDAKASLDAVRAARNFGPARAGARFVDYGWSQGGQTTLWVASLGKAYAPELQLLGGVPIAPAVNTLGLTQWDIKYPPMGAYLVTTAAGLNISHPDLRLRDILTPAGLELLATMANGCGAARQTVQSLKEPVADPAALEPGKPCMSRGVVGKMCAMGNRVDYREVADRNHGTIVADARTAIPDWFDARFEGPPAADTCSSHR
jgi:hypothetical protein